MEENPEPVGPQQNDDEDWKKLLKQLMDHVQKQTDITLHSFVCFVFLGGAVGDFWGA